MRTRLLIPGLALVMISAAVAAVVDGYDLKRVVKTGDEFTYKFEASFEYSGQAVKVVGKNIEKVVKVGDSSYVIEGTEKDAKVTFGDSTVDQKDSKPTGTEYGFDNVAKKIDDEEAVTGTESYRMSNLQVIPTPDKPVKVGDKWTHEFAAMPVKIIGKDLTTPKATGDYEVLAEEVVLGVPCVKVKATFKELEGEAPASAESTVWLNAKTFEQVKLTSKMKNAPIPALPPVDVTFSLEKI